MLTQRDPWSRKIGKPYRPVGTVRALNEDAREIPRIISDAKAAGHSTRPATQHVVPVAQSEQMHAVAANAAVFERQEVQKEPISIGRLAERLGARGQRIIPGGSGWDL